jgi:hypothetical protein
MISSRTGTARMLPFAVLDFGGKIPLWRSDADSSSIPRGKRDNRRAGVDREVDQPAVDAPLDQEMPARVARHDHRT